MYILYSAKKKKIYNQKSISEIWNRMRNYIKRKKNVVLLIRLWLERTRQNKYIYINTYLITEEKSNTTEIEE
jgi:hypothetical protein